MTVTAFDIAGRFVGLSEVAGASSNPAVLAMLRMDGDWPTDDSVPWCSAFVNYIAWLLRLPRSKSLRARSWLGVGRPIELAEARSGFDVVVLSRGLGPQPGPEMLDAPGHVGFFGALFGESIHILGGNQNDRVSVAPFPTSRVLGVRRLLG